MSGGGAPGRAYTYVATVYAGTDAVELSRSVGSMLGQTVPPAEVVAVLDGPVPDDVRGVVLGIGGGLRGGLKVVELEENRGPGYAAARGVEAAGCGLVARLDSDDVARPGRIERQLAELERDPGLACVGSLVVERHKQTGRERLVGLPGTDEEFRAFARRRCPIRQSTLLVRRDAVMAVGNWRELRFAEDRDICNRLIAGGYRCRNVQEPLVTMMVDDAYYARRGGLAVVRRVTSFKLDMLRSGQMGLADFVVSAGSTAAVGLMPNGLRRLVYENLLRGGARLGADLPRPSRRVARNRSGARALAVAA